MIFVDLNTVDFILASGERTADAETVVGERLRDRVMRTNAVDPIPLVANNAHRGSRAALRRQRPSIDRQAPPTFVDGNLVVLPRTHRGGARANDRHAGHIGCAVCHRYQAECISEFNIE
ncbi:hypothetical protein [Pandoraea anhela]|uniref:hypothetical protein n=1 Tax=Pandoraea anhela TaxID=2508295 RepID=UPI001FEAEBF5|nr:hypothetical protein [Pandoraea anhela]